MQKLVASWFGSGLILARIRGDHSGSGTVGGAVAFVIAVAIGEQFGVWAQVVALVVVVIASIWSTDPFVVGEGDAGWIVVDEAAGTFLAVLGLGFSPSAFVAFLVFRAADIFKGVFPGVAAAEDIGGPIGVTADDLVAGVYGLIAGQAARILL